jgi:beta-xylosidase
MLPGSQKPQSKPVYPEYFADPFVWNWKGVYYAVGTGALEAEGKTAGKIFPLLQSTDLLHWESAGRAMLPPAPGLGANFWAPEVACVGGRFYLYYSVGHGDKNHQLRVAIGEAPLGPYEDAGVTLLDPGACAFAIDPHPFHDTDGKQYLFYARDFLDVSAHARAGTALMVARMKSPTELESEGRMVLRARSDWQRFEANRSLYGRTWDWHTLEGPCVRKYRGRYYCFYSGGRWETENYGVDYGVADSVMGPYSDAGNESGPRVLRTIPDHLLGPGHNSIITGPDGATEFIVYHAWNPGLTARRMFVDRLDWNDGKPRCEWMRSQSQGKSSKSE